MTIVETRAGKIEGEAGNGIFVFRGIPFAAPPVGDLRWRAPEAAKPWTGVRSAKNYATQSWQGPAVGGPLAGLMSADVDNAEDCLYLNVWTPAADDRARPVMVWIHGGGFTIGSGAQNVYEGTALAKRGDVVVVSINYRLGALGFLRLTDVSNGRIPSTGNEGLLDQIHALEWVRDNISRFGGDPGNVTIFGESAGGMSVGCLLGMPRARGLFKRAIPQSGACSTAYPSVHSSEVADGFLKYLKLDAAALMEMDPQKLTASAGMYQLQGGSMAFQPCVENSAMPTMPLDAVKNGNADGVSIMVGACANEWALFGAMDPSAGNLDEGGLNARINSRAGSGAKALIDGYRKMLGARGEPTDPASLFCAIETDRVFRMPALRLAEALAARGTPAHHYEFTWRSPMLNGRLRSPHAIDVAFVFATHAQNDGVAAFCGAGPSADTLAATVQDAWTSFARTGVPSSAALDGWKPYTDATPVTAVLDVPARVATRLLGGERQLWEGHADGAVVGKL